MTDKSVGTGERNPSPSPSTPPDSKAIVSYDDELKAFVAQVAAMTDVPEAINAGLAGIHADLQDVFERVADNPEAQDSITAVWNTISMIGDMATRMVAVVAGAGSLIQSVSAQRDKAIDELAKLVEAVEREDYEHPMVRKLAENMEEGFCLTFWESLPYDLGNILGIKFYEASMLYEAITLDMEEEIVDVDYQGFSEEALNHFRDKLRRLVEDLAANITGDSEDAEDDQDRPGVDD